MAPRCRHELMPRMGWPLVLHAVTPDMNTERLSADDQATQREEQFLQAALHHQAQRAEAERQAGTRGRCANCASHCLPLARYCDEDCQADHERRLQVLRRQGRVGR